MRTAGGGEEGRQSEFGGKPVRTAAAMLVGLHGELVCGRPFSLHDIQVTCPECFRNINPISAEQR